MGYLKPISLVGFLAGIWILSCRTTQLPLVERKQIPSGAKDFAGFGTKYEPEEVFVKKEEGEGFYLHPSEGKTACAECHQNQFQDWQISNHAYAFKDPVFHAMHRLGTAETQGKLMNIGFCVQCHSFGAFTNEKHLNATTKLKFGETLMQDMDLSKVESADKEGVHCDICHSIEKNHASFNAKMSAPATGIRNGAIKLSELTTKPSHPVQVPLDAKGRPLFKQSEVCGPCHAVVNPKGAPIEETFAEWEVFSLLSEKKGQPVKTCQECHMEERNGLIAKCKSPDSPSCEESLAERSIHDHSFVGVDVSLLPPEEFPGYDSLRERVGELLKTAATMEAKVMSNGIEVSIENHAGHAFPSGATAERQLWLHILVKDSRSQDVVWSTGTVDANGDLRDDVDYHSLDAGTDPMLVKFGQEMLKTKLGISRDVPITKANRNMCKISLLDNLKHEELATFPWPAEDVCNNILMPYEKRVINFPFNKMKDMSGNVLANGEYEIEIDLVFRSFPPYFLQILIDKAGLDADVKERLVFDTGNHNLKFYKSTSTAKSPKAFQVGESIKMKFKI